MKAIKKLFLFIGSVIATTTFAQQSEGVKEEGAHEAEYNANAQDRDHSGEIDSRQNGDAADGNQNANAGEQTNFGATAENVIISPAGTRTTSPAGSPGVLMEDSSIPDGTNTKQSAEPNIAGSPVPGAGRANAAGSQDSDVPDNKVFSGDEQNAVPMNAKDRKNSDDLKRKKGSQSDDMQKG